MKIRPATKRDLPGVLGLVRKLAAFEKLTPPDAAAARRYARHGFGRAPYFRVLVLDAGGTPAGYAFYFFTYSTFLARPTLFLEDLFILPEFRGRGWGERTLRELAKIAARTGCGRMDWQVLDWNVKAQSFYLRLGARHLREWFNFRLDRKGIGRLISRRRPPPRRRPARSRS